MGKLDELAASVEPQKAKKETEKIKIETIDDKFKALSSVGKLIDKQFNTTNSLVRLGNKVVEPVPAVSTGLPSLDYILGTGLPIGRILEAYGAESGGKTTLALHFIAEYQKQGHLCCLIDAEHAFDPSWATRLHVDTTDLFVNQPDSGEEALTLVEEIAKTGAVGLIVIDSVSALVPQAELDGDMGSSFMGLQARLMSQSMRKLRGIANENNCTLLFLNQIREKIGIVYGNPEVTSGGRALRFYSSIRMDIRRKEQIKDGDTVIGQAIKIKCTKNKVSTPFRETIINLYYDSGIDTLADLIQYAVNKEVIVQKGSWFSFNGEKLGQGLSNVKDSLQANPELLQAIRATLSSLGTPSTVLEK